MDRIYRHQRHVYDLTRKYYLLGRDGLIRSLDPPPAGAVLEIGCGTGRNLIAAARLYPDARLFGLDISDEMLRTAEANIRRAGLAGRIRIARADATGFDAGELFGQAMFDRIFFSYTLSMIPAWQDAVDSALAHLSEGGRLHIVDFGQLERLPGICRTALFAWLRRFHVSARADLPECLQECALRHGHHVQFRSGLRGYAWSARLTRRPGHRM
jgi:S-adenosylmethionine-diacylgycerolhomoserine-N-methlytransferase